MEFPAAVANIVARMEAAIGTSEEEKRLNPP